MSGRIFAGAKMVALWPIDIGKIATLIISILKITESVKEKLKREYEKVDVADSIIQE